MKQKTLKTPEADEEWKCRLRASSMKIGFVLCLTKTMLEFLCAVADDVQWDRSLYHQNIPFSDNWIASERALEKRGLIQRKSAEWFEANKHNREPFCERSTCVLTPAGKAVVELIKMAGMFTEADAAINKKAKRA